MCHSSRNRKCELFTVGDRISVEEIATHIHRNARMRNILSSRHMKHEVAYAEYFIPKTALVRSRQSSSFNAST